MRDSITLCRKPYVWLEKGMLRWPGMLEITWPRFGLALEIINEGEDHEHAWPWMLHLNLLWLNIFLHFPAPKRALELDRGGYKRYGEWDHWGFATTWDELGALHLHWGRRYKVFDWPWTYTFIYKEDLRTDGVWVREPHWKLGQARPEIEKLTRLFAYTYQLKSGEVQHRIATVTEQRFYRRRRFLKWTRWLEWVDHCIDVQFSDEVGERSGSWKGGCTGCGYTVLPGETSEQCLRRMERERKF